jgi:hypothetical protein
MASSPPSAGTPRTASPLDDASHSLSTTPEDDAHTMAIQNEAEGVMKTGVAANVVSAPTTDDEVNNTCKGKEKVSKGPLRLLDLPVDILKEIIHQVHMSFFASHGCYALSASGHTNVSNLAASAYQRPDVSLALPLGFAPAHDTMHLLAIRYCMARREHAHGAALRRRCAHLWPGDAGHGR